MAKVPYAKPSITNLEIEYVNDAIRNGWGDNCYGYINELQERFSEFLGIKFSVATSSCTGALHLGLAALGIGPGDEVILADTNWIATAAPIVHLGATPIFVDILEDSWCIDPEKVRKSITSKTKAIIVTHLYGNAATVYRLLDIAKQSKIYLIEDSAEAIGTYVDNKHVGTFGDFGVFSFHGTKTITTGEGGMFVTNNSDLFSKVMTLNNHGRRSNQVMQFWPEEVGYKFKISNVAAAIGCAQIERIDELIQRKREIFFAYQQGLSNLSEISMNLEGLNEKNGYWMPTIVYSKKSEVSREVIQREFAKADIDARVFFWPLSSLPMFRKKLQNFNSYSIASRAINLPSFHDISEAQINLVCDVIQRISCTYANQE